MKAVFTKYDLEAPTFGFQIAPSAHDGPVVPRDLWFAKG
jgi:hypothetical protein